jgi:hypothetical protein
MLLGMCNAEGNEKDEVKPFFWTREISITQGNDDYVHQCVKPCHDNGAMVLR